MARTLALFADKGRHDVVVGDRGRYLHPSSEGDSGGLARLHSEPRILVLADDDGVADALTRGLDGLGWPTVTARSLASAEAVIADFAIDGVILASPMSPDPVARLKAAGAPRTLPVLALGAAPAAGADLHMSGPAHPAQLALRLEQLLRAAVAEEEFVLRRDTLALKGVELSVEADQRPLRVLAAGAADRRFLALSNAIADAGGEVIGAPTPYTAFDYLHESPFDAAVLWGGPDHAPALSIASGMKRNTRLYHIPLMLYLRDSGEIDLGEVFQRGVADVAAADTSEEETARRVLALASAYRRHQGLRRALESSRASGLMDAATGLFTRDLFASHLNRVIEGARRRRRPISLCVLRVGSSAEVARARSGGWLERAMPQIGSMVSRLVRAEDTAARLSPEVFALALPATRAQTGRLAAERIAAVIGCTAFDAGPDQAPFVIGFDIGVAEIQPGESPLGVLERASADMGERAKVAG